MGVFKSMRDLQKQAKQIEATMPPVADRMAAAQARMAAANQMMAAQTQAANAAVAAAAGTAGPAARRTVTITGMRQIGMMNFDLLVEFDLTVLPDGLPRTRPRPSSASARCRSGSFSPVSPCRPRWTRRIRRPSGWIWRVSGEHQAAHGLAGTAFGIALSTSLISMLR